MVRVLSNFHPKHITVLLLFCFCMEQPSSPTEKMQAIRPAILWKTAGDYPSPQEVDSLRFTVFSHDDKFTDTITRTFFFDDHQGTLSVPAGLKLIINVEGIDEEDEVIYKGAVLVDDASDRNITIVLDASHVSPRKPSDFSGAAYSACNFNIGWLDRSNNETGFIIEYSSDNDEFVTLDTTRRNQTSYLHSNVSFADRHFYRISAYNDAGISDELEGSIKSPPVSERNMAPQFLQSSDKISGDVFLDQTKEIILQIIDPECDDFSIKTHPLIHRSGNTFTWTPGVSDIGKIRMWVAAIDNSNAKDTLFWTWNVIDTISPELILNMPDTINIAINDRYVDPGARAFDNVDGDISDKVTIDKPVNTSHAGTYRLVYSVSDQSGNEAEKKTRIVYVKPGSYPDRTPPVIFLNGGDTIRLGMGEEFIDPGVYALDNRDDSTSITGKITSSGTVDITHEGTYQIIYKVRDNAGYEAQQVRYVKVEGNRDDD